MKNGNGVHILGGRKPHDKGADLCTKAEATAIADNVARFYIEQVPGLVEKMLLAAGITIPPPVEAPQEPT